MNTTTEREILKRYKNDPVYFVKREFNCEPDEWQKDVLTAFPVNQRIAMAACKGPGKSTVLALLIWNYLLTRLHSQAACTSVTSANLSDGLWKELAKWQKKSRLLSSQFTWTKTRIYQNDHPETWFCSFRTWPKKGSVNDQADTLAGLHADYMLFVLDEVGSIPDAVMVAAEAGLASGIEPKIMMAGNPTHLTGPLYKAATKTRKRWHFTNITGDPDDPKRSPRVGIEWAKDMIADYGRESPWVLVNVFGQFPPASIDALLGVEEIRKAMERNVTSEDVMHAQKRLGVDVARFGDDANVLFPRQGLLASSPTVLRNLRSDAIADHVIDFKMNYQQEVEYVDNTGGYGSGVIDSLIRRNHSPQEINFSEMAMDKMRYANRRAEMYFRMAQWVKRGGKLPDDPELEKELTETTYTFQGDRLIIELKSMIKARLGRSPDKTDGLILTFADEERDGMGTIEEQLLSKFLPNKHRSEFDPFDPSRR